MSSQSSSGLTRSHCILKVNWRAQLIFMGACVCGGGGGDGGAPVCAHALVCMRVHGCTWVYALMHICSLCSLLFSHCDPLLAYSAYFRGDKINVWQFISVCADVFGMNRYDFAKSLSKRSLYFQWYSEKGFFDNLSTTWRNKIWFLHIANLILTARKSSGIILFLYFLCRKNTLKLLDFIEFQRVSLSSETHSLVWNSIKSVIMRVHRKILFVLKLLLTMWKFKKQEPLVAVEPRRRPMTNVAIKTAFRHDHCKHFQKTKHLLESEVSWCNQRLAQTPKEAFSAWGQSSRRNFTGGFRSWLPATCRFSTRRSFDHHGKGNSNCI